MTSLESSIRDKLSDRLELIEPRLQLLATEYRLPNAHGTHGRIDILARDRNGVFVVLELKRSDQTARQALHEVMKYTELLQQEKGIDASEIRSVIVSTHWDELRVPFSHFKRGWSGEIRGYDLNVTDDGLPLSATEVSALPETPEHGLTPIHISIFPSIFLADRTGGFDVDLAWEQVVGLLHEVGVDDVIGVQISHVPRGTALYLILGRMIVDDPRTSALDSLIEEIPDDTVEAPEEYVWEYRALCYMTERLDYDRYSVATAYPEKLAALTETGGWQVDRVLRAGIFARQIDLYPDSDVLDRAVDRAGQSVMRFSGSARPAHRQHWTTFKERISHALMGNNSWQKTLFAWLDETAIQAPDADVHCHVYNPCDLMAALVYGWPDRLQFYVPGLRAGVDAPPPDGRMLQGVLTWTGNTKEVQRVIRTVYAEPGDWAMSRTLGEAWRYDLRLLKALGLRYSLFEWSEGYPNGALLKIDRTRLRRRAPDAIDASGAPTWRSLRQLPEFVSAHWRQLDDVMGEFREHVDIDLGAGVQITW